MLDGLGIAIAMVPPAVVTAKTIAAEPGGESFDDDAKWVAGGTALAAVGVVALARGSRATARCEKAHLDFERWMSDAAGPRASQRGP